MKGIRKKTVKRLGRQLVSFVLIVAMLLGIIPQSAYATSAVTTMAEREYTSGGCILYQV